MPALIGGRQQTGQVIAEAFGQPLRVLEGMQEQDTGLWTGRSYRHFQTHAQELHHPDGSFGFPGGESVRMVARRFGAALNEALALGGTPILVSHGLALRALLAELLGLPFEALWQGGSFPYRNTAFTELRLENGSWTAEQLTVDGHLSPLR